MSLLSIYNLQRCQRTRVEGILVNFTIREIMELQILKVNGNFNGASNFFEKPVKCLFGHAEHRIL